MRVTDSAGNTYDEVFTINVTNGNEAPTDLALSANTVAENSANGTVVGQLSAVDPDASDTATYSLVDNAGGRFAIDGSNIVVAGALDYETATSHQVTVRVTDSAGNTYDETFTVNVNNVNEAPTDLALSANTVAENSANGTIVGQLSAVDPDASDTATYSLVDNAGGRFAIDGSNIVVAGALDNESATSHQVTVRVTDSAGNTYDEVFTINVTNGNDGADDLALSSRHGGGEQRQRHGRGPALGG